MGEQQAGDGRGLCQVRHLSFLAPADQRQCPQPSISLHVVALAILSTGQAEQGSQAAPPQMESGGDDLASSDPPGLCHDTAEWCRARAWHHAEPMALMVAPTRHQRPAAGKGRGLLCFIHSSLKMLFFFLLSRKRKINQNAAGKDLEHANTCTRLSGHVSIFPRRSHGDDPLRRSPSFHFRAL